MPKSSKGTSKQKLAVSTSISDFSLNRARQQINKWEGDRKQIGLEALNDLLVGGRYSGFFIKDENGKVQAIASYTEWPDSLHLERMASSGRSKGIGTLAFNEVAKRASNKNIGLDLDATDGSRSYYQKLGMNEYAPNKFRWNSQEVNNYLRSK